MLVPFGDVGELTKAISKLLEDNILAENLGKTGFKKSNEFTDINNLHSFEKICLKIISEYKSNNLK